MPGTAAAGTPWLGASAAGFNAETPTLGGGYPPGTGPYGPWVAAAHGSGLPGDGMPSAGGV